MFVGDADMAYPFHTRVAMRPEIARTAFALKHYQDAEGQYPSNLDALVPRYLDAVPIDRLNGKPVGYDLDDEGFVLVTPDPHDYPVPVWQARK